MQMQWMKPRAVEKDALQASPDKLANAPHRHASISLLVLQVLVRSDMW